MKAASAPGKLLLSGEYAVLRGAPAIVAAVDARAIATLDPTAEGEPPQPEAREARKEAERHFGAAPGRLAIDVSALRSEDKKLGLGSSAAAAAAAAGVVALARGRDLSDEGVRRAVFEAAFEGHRIVAPQGSGVDVAASALGGYVRFARRGDAAEAASVALPEGLFLEVVWTGKEARTSDFLAKVEALRASDAAAHARAFERLLRGADALAEAFARGDAHAVVEGAEAYGAAMEALGAAAGAPIVEETLASIRGLAAECGGSAKPSGAGGGDVAVAFFTDLTSVQKFRSRCAAGRFTLLPLRLGAEGVRPGAR